MNKKNLLILLPGPIYRPNLANFRDRFEMLSKNFAGVILTSTSGTHFSNYKINNFKFIAKPNVQHGILFKLKLACFIIQKACTYNKTLKFDAIISYDPMYSGFIGLILKFILRCKLIIEINTNTVSEAVELHEGVTWLKKFKMTVYEFLGYIALKNSDAIRCLTMKQKNYFKKKYPTKAFYVFHDFAATHYFSNKIKSEKCILFIGFPFYLKGCDLLIKAFDAISKDHPDFSLKLIGYQLEEDSKKYFNNINPKVEFHKAVHFDELKSHFENCYCFVLASRSEGVARVLIEAMASGKPIIGSNVGGIPNLIEDGKNGFIFEKENVKQLAEKLSILLSNPNLAKDMGNYGKTLVDEHFSSHKHCSAFTNMLNEIFSNNK